MKIGHFLTGLLAGCVAFFTIVATQAMTGQESAACLLLVYSVGWFFLFGAAAVLPMLLNATPVATEKAKAPFFAFGAGGGIAGGLFVVLMITGQIPGPSATTAKLGLAIPFTIPWIVGAVIMVLLRHLRP